MWPCACPPRYLLLRTHQLSLDAFLVALKFMQVEDVDIDEVQCILANLIYMVRRPPQPAGSGAGGAHVVAGKPLVFVRTPVIPGSDRALRGRRWVDTVCTSLLCSVSAFLRCLWSRPLTPGAEEG